MNREEFAKRLDGIQIQEGTDPKILYDSVLPISDALTQMMPQSLFRYRLCGIGKRTGWYDIRRH